MSPRMQFKGSAWRARFKLLLTVALLAFVSSPIFASAARPDPTDFAWQPHPGGETPLDLPFTDTAGQRTSLRTLGGVPTVLTLGYFSCPTLCGPVRDDLIAALAASKLEGGRDYRVAVLSIDDKETIDDAIKAKLTDLKQPGDTGQGWYYLVGPAAPVAAAIGFPYRWDADLQQFAHPAGVVVLTPTGRIASYLEGVGYTGAAMREAIEAASAEQVAATPSPILLLCFHYDASTGKYTLEIYKVLRIMAVMTLVGIAGLLVLLHRKRQRVM